MKRVALAAGRRAVEGGLTLAAVLAGAFIALRLAPGDPAGLRLQAGMVAPDPAALDQLRRSLGLDQPLWSQFCDWIVGLARLDPGRSLMTDRPVVAELLDRLPWSFVTGCGGLLLGVASGVALGYLAAIRRGGAVAVAGRTLAIASQSAPAFATATLVFWLLAIELHLIRPVLGTPAERLAGPVIVVALYAAGSFARVTDGILRSIESSPWFTTALAKGLSRRRALVTHGWQHVAIACAALVAPELAWAIGGTAVVEIVFGLPGLSGYIVEAAAMRDYAVLQVYLAAMFAWLALVYAAVAAVRKWLDPRPAWSRS